MTELYATYQSAGINPRRTTGNEKTTCPQCSQKRHKTHDQCLSINHDKGTWYCHHCGFKGGLEGLYTMVNTFPAPPTRTYVKPPKLKPFDEMADVWDQTIDWFAKRGISKNTVLDNHISVTKEWMPQFNEEIPVIAFPYHRDGQTVNIKYRGRDKSFKMVKDAESIWYGLDDCLDSDYVVLVEGELDKLALWEAGIKAAMSVPNGAPTPDAKVTAKFEFYPSGKDVIKAASTVIVATDNDGPGHRLAHELARRADFNRCRRVYWPVGCKDANDVLMKYGAEKLRESVFNSRPWPVEGVIDPQSIFENVWMMKTTPIYKGVDTGWDNLSDLYKPAAGQLTTVGGTPGSGKSVFLNALFVNIAIRYGWTFGLYSPEYFPVEFHVRDLMSCYLGKPLSLMTMEEAEKANRWVAEHFRIICPLDNDHITPDLDWVLKTADDLVDGDNIKGFLIDPWTEVEAYRPDGHSQTEYINKALTRLRKWCRMKGVHGWVSAHPAKMHPTQDGSTPIVTPYDLAGSAHWFNKSDNILSVFRDKNDDTQPVQIHVQKVRFAEEGGLGMAELHFDKYTKRYTAAMRD